MEMKKRNTSRKNEIKKSFGTCHCIKYTTTQYKTHKKQYPPRLKDHCSNQKETARGSHATISKNSHGRHYCQGHKLTGRKGVEKAGPLKHYIKVCL